VAQNSVVSLPTPYDITPIPTIPWVPGWLAWLVLLAALAIGVVSALGRHARLRRTRRGDVVDMLLSEISSVAHLSHNDDAERLSHLVRRVVTYLSGIELSSLSPHELEAIATTASSPALQQTLFHLSQLEVGVYAPPNAQDSLPQVAQQLTRVLHEYVREARIP